MSSEVIGQLDPVSGRKGDVSVTLTGLSFRQKRGERRFPYADFGAEFLNALHSQLPEPRRKGLLRRQLVCPACESELDRTGTAVRPVSVEVALARIPPIRVDLELPAMACPSCRRTVVDLDRDLASDLSDALIEAFNAGGVQGP